MSTVTYDVARTTRAIAPAAVRASKMGLFARFFDALMASRLRQASEEIQRHRHLLPRELDRADWKINDRSEDSLPFRG